MVIKFEPDICPHGFSNLRWSCALSHAFPSLVPPFFMFQKTAMQAPSSNFGLLRSAKKMTPWPPSTHPPAQWRLWPPDGKCGICWYMSYDTMRGIGQIGDTDWHRTRCQKSHTQRQLEDQADHSGDDWWWPSRTSKLQVKAIGIRYWRQLDQRHGQSQTFPCTIDFRSKRGKCWRSQRPLAKQKKDSNRLSGSCQEDSHSYLFGRRDRQ